MGVTIINHGACECCSDGPCASWPGLPDNMMLPLALAGQEYCDNGSSGFDVGYQHFDNANAFLSGREELFPYTGVVGSACQWFSNVTYPTGTVTVDHGTYNTFVRVNLRLRVSATQALFFVLYSISVPAITAYPDDTCSHINQKFYSATPSNMNDFLSQPSFILNFDSETNPTSPVLDGYGSTVEIFRA